MRRLKVAAILLLAASSALSGVGAAAAPVSHNEAGAEATEQVCRKEFDDVCSKTQDAMSFSTEQLAGLVQRCDALLPKIQKLNDTQKKVYLRRLEQCRGLYAYVLDSKKNEGK